MTGRVRCASDGFWPEILVGDVVSWAPLRPLHDVWTARWELAEAVALVGLCFWPPSHLNDNGRELGVSPWVDEQIRAAFNLGQNAVGLPPGRYELVPPIVGSTLRSTVHR